MIADISTRAAVIIAGLASITCLSPSMIATGVANGALGEQPQIEQQRARAVEVRLGRREERMLEELARIHGTTPAAELARIIETELEP